MAIVSLKMKSRKKNASVLFGLSHQNYIKILPNSPFRGLPSNGKEAFPKVYGQLGNLCAMFNKPFLCLIATANKSTTRKIVQLLHLKNYKTPQKSQT